MEHIILDSTYINKEMTSNLEIILNHYLEQVLGENEHSSFDEVICSNWVIAELYDYLDKDVWDDKLFENMTYLRECIMDNRFFNNISLFGGLSKIGFSTYVVYKSTGYFEKFLYSINNLIASKAEDFLSSVEAKSNITSMDFDLISGVSGVASYLLEFEDHRDIVVRSLQYLCSLCENRIVEGEELPGWFIEWEDLPTDDDRALYPYGYINLSLSHGIAGPLGVLTKAKEAGIEYPWIDSTINFLVDYYLSNTKYREGDGFWVGKTHPSPFESEISPRCRESWCYGSLAIAITIYRASIAIHDQAATETISSIIGEKLSYNESKYYLSSPTICHGYAGVLCMLNSLRDDFDRASHKSEVLATLLINMYVPTSKYGFEDIEHREIDNKIIVDKQDINSILNGGAGVILSLISAYNKSGFVNKFLMIS